MRYTRPAIEHRLEIGAQLGTTLPSQTVVQPVWRPTKVQKPEQHG